MTFRDWQLSFQGYGDDVICSLGVTPQELNEWKTFVRDYRAAHPRYVGNLELIQAYWTVFPGKKNIGELTVDQARDIVAGS